MQLRERKFGRGNATSHQSGHWLICEARHSLRCEMRNATVVSSFFSLIPWRNLEVCLALGLLLPLAPWAVKRACMIPSLTLLVRQVSHYNRDNIPTQYD